MTLIAQTRADHGVNFMIFAGMGNGFAKRIAGG